ncbi:MAG: glycerophosphodiester phosphodiesterase family protein, partial [Bacteroidota bacterium]|nr:glycerophosphodiester phosphodiesterase family protein [Bacteroidota bacterium]
GHKGAAGYAPENTLTSFQMAITISCDRAELDVKRTKDGKIVVFHDDEVSRLTNGVGFVSEMTLSDLKKLDYEKGEKIPTLQEVIDLCKNKINLQIELKADGTPGPVNELIKKNDIQNQIVITSFRDYLLKEIKQLNPDLKVGLLFKTEEVMSEIWNLMESVPLDFFAPYSGLVTKEFVDKAHSLGKTVYAYQVNEKELGDRLAEMGVDDIGTDYPKLFIKE